MAVEIYMKTGFGRRIREIASSATLALKHLYSNLYTSVVGPDFPSVIDSPLIDGLTDVGDTLTLTTGEYGGNPVPTVTVQWLRNGAPIVGATGSGYVLVADDEGTAIQVVETVTNTAGTIQAVSNTMQIP